MGYYSTLNKQIGEYKVDAKRQTRNDMKQMIKYQAFLENEAIDDRLAEKLATLYGDVQTKIIQKAPKPEMKAEVNPEVLAQQMLKQKNVERAKKAAETRKKNQRIKIMNESWIKTSKKITRTKKKVSNNLFSTPPTSSSSTSSFEEVLS